MTEVRLIDANKLLKQRFNMYTGFQGTVPVVAVRDIENAPTIDTENLRAKGHWIWSEFMDDNWRTLCCSECFEIEGARENAKYCPNCGAKMEV